MSLSERLARAPRGRGHGCSIGVVLATIDSLDLHSLIAAMEDDAITGVTIARILNEEGYEVNVKHIHQHRRSGCNTGFCPAPHVGLTKK